jgi:hypothetical protein
MEFKSRKVLMSDSGKMFIPCFMKLINELIITQSKPSPRQLYSYYLDHNIHIQYHDVSVVVNHSQVNNFLKTLLTLVYSLVCRYYPNFSFVHFNLNHNTHKLGVTFLVISQFHYIITFKTFKGQLKL